MVSLRYASLLLLAIPAAASAQSMNAETFFIRSTALKAKGAVAIFSMGEIKALIGEAQRAIEASNAVQLSDAAAGRPPRSCARVGKSSINSDEFMTRLAAIPAAVRARIDMTEAMTRISAAKFPCGK